MWVVSGGVNLGRRLGAKQRADSHQSGLKRREPVKNVLFDGLKVADFARRLLLAGRDPVDAALDPACDLFLTGSDAGGDPVEALPHRVAIERYCFERSDLSGRVAVGLPSQSDCHANGKGDQVAGEGERLQSAEPAERVQVAE